MGRKDWSNEVIVNVIEMYRDRPALWKLNHPDYMNKIVKNEGYKEIAEELSKQLNAVVDAAAVKAKLQNLRTSFRKELKKVDVSQRSGAGVEAIYEPTLWYYEQLSFVKEQDTPVRSATNHPGSLGTSPERQMSDNDDEQDEETNQEGGSDKEKHSYFKKPQEPAAKRSRKTKSVDRNISQFLETCAAAISMPCESDECYTTGRYIAQKLQKMTEPQQVLAESIIQTVLSKGLKHQLTETTELVDTASCGLIPPYTTFEVLSPQHVISPTHTELQSSRSCSSDSSQDSSLAGSLAGPHSTLMGTSPQHETWPTITELRTLGDSGKSQ